MVNSLANAATYRSLLAKTPQLAHLMPPPPPPQLSEEAVIELLNEDSWPDHLKPEAGAPTVAATPPTERAAAAAESTATETQATESKVIEAHPAADKIQTENRSVQEYRRDQG
jgi:hypothetical protein